MKCTEAAGPEPKSPQGDRPRAVAPFIPSPLPLDSMGLVEAWGVSST
jgi:hypothetical protein